MKVILINPDYMLYSDPPLGLAYLAAYIRRETNFDVEILDQLNDPEIENKIKEIKPEVIGFTAVSTNYHRVKELGKKISKISPNSILVIGGVHVTTCPESFKNSVFHITLRGEGEIAFTKLLKSLEKNKVLNIEELKKIKGLLFRNKNKIIDNGLAEQIENLDDLPFPARDLLNMRYYSLPSILSEGNLDPVGAILTSRGCPYNCKFCSSSSFWERKMRFFSAEKVVNEIEILYKKYKYKNISIYDDLFSINKTRIKTIITLLKKKKLLGKIKFYIYGRSNIFDEEMARLLRKLNVISVIFGFESGSQKVLSYLKGGAINVEDNEKAVKIAKKYDIIGDGFFMLGSPYETLEDMEKTYKFIRKNCKEHFIIYQTISFPGTEIWRYAIKNKIIKPDYYEKKQKDFIDIDTNILLSKKVSKEEFKKIFYKIKSFHTNINKNVLFKKILLVRPRHIVAFLSFTFLKKAYTLRKQFIKRVFKV